MTIDQKYFASIRELNVDAHKPTCEWHYWEAQFADQPEVYRLVQSAKESLGNVFGRAEVTAYYANGDVPIEGKFLAAMIWGHEAPLGSRRDRRGPWKVAKMFGDLESARQALRSVEIGSETQLRRSYGLQRDLERCGPSFFTKHLYFLGKANRIREYPVIFDDRAASGLVKLNGPQNRLLSMVRISAVTKVDAYMRYWTYVHEQAARVDCEADQIEYFLFTL